MGIFPFSALYLPGRSAQALSSSSAPMVAPALGLGSASSFGFLFCSSLCSGRYLLLIMNRFRFVLIEASGEDTSEQAVPLIQTQRDPERTTLPSGGAYVHRSLGLETEITHPLLLAFGDEPHTFRTQGEVGAAGGFPPPTIWASQILWNLGSWLFMAFSRV